MPFRSNALNCNIGSFDCVVLSIGVWVYIEFRHSAIELPMILIKRLVSHSISNHANGRCLTQQKHILRVNSDQQRSEDDG